MSLQHVLLRAEWSQNGVSGLLNPHSTMFFLNHIGLLNNVLLEEGLPQLIKFENH